MIIKDLNIRSFGKFSNETINEFQSGINIIYGKNEAGKTTLYNIIQTLLYGFAPANIDKHPYASYNSNILDFSGTIIDKKNNYLVDRKLSSLPKASYFYKDKKHNLRNEPLPQCKHISKVVYRGLYTLSAEDINDLDTTLWDSIEDKLLSNYGILGIKNPRDIVGDLNKDIDKLYKKSKRGKSQIRELKERLKNLRKERKHILAMEREIRDVDMEMKLAIEELTYLKEKRFTMETALKELEGLIPIKSILDEIETIEDKLSNYDRYMGAPVDIDQRYQELLEQKKGFEEDRDAVIRSINNHKSRIMTVEKVDYAIIENINQLRALSKEIERFDARRSINLNRDLELRKIKKNINDELYNIFYTDLSDEVIEKINKISKHSILNKVRKLKEKEDLLNQYKMKLNLLKETSPSELKFSIIYIVALILSPISLVGRYLDNTILQYVGVVLALIGCFGLFNYLSFTKLNTSNEVTEKREH